MSLLEKQGLACITSQAAVKSDMMQPRSYDQHERTHSARSKFTERFVWDNPGCIYREDADGAPNVDALARALAARCALVHMHQRGGWGGRKAWGRTQQLGSSREFPSVGAMDGALCYRRPLRRTGTGGRWVVLCRLASRGRQNASCEAGPSNTIPAERGRTPSDGRYCVSGSYSCVSFVNSPMAEPDSVVVLVTDS